MSRSKVWFERRLPQEYLGLLGDLTAIGGRGLEGLAEAAEADGVVASSRVHYDAQFMDCAPRLKVIARTGKGLDNVVVDAATERGIVVCYVPDGPTTSTAEHTFALILALARDLPGASEVYRNGHRDYFNEYQGIELAGLTLGVVGLGAIGVRVARLALAFEMKVMAYDPAYGAASATVDGVSVRTELSDVLRSADFVTLHVPLAPETIRLIDAERFAEMKRGCIFVNTSRGEVVDEVALIQALESGRLRGAGLDVLETEPPPANSPLLGRDDVIVTPHIAGATTASKERLWRSAISQVRDVLEGRVPEHVVNRDVLKPV